MYKLFDVYIFTNREHEEKKKLFNMFKNKRVNNIYKNIKNKSQTIIDLYMNKNSKHKYKSFGFTKIIFPFVI